MHVSGKQQIGNTSSGLGSRLPYPAGRCERHWKQLSLIYGGLPLKVSSGRNSCPIVSSKIKLVFLLLGPHPLMLCVEGVWMVVGTINARDVTRASHVREVFSIYYIPRPYSGLVLFCFLRNGGLDHIQLCSGLISGLCAQR